MPWTRFSEVDRALLCPASTHLVRLAGKSANAVVAAEWGTKVHAWKETGDWPLATKGKWKGKVELPCARRNAALIASDITREDLWPADGLHEVSYALHTETSTVGQMIGGTQEEREAWKNSHDNHWITGTADYVGDILGIPWVDDLKTGNPVYLPNDPVALGQLRGYLLCRMLLEPGAPYGWVSITSWPHFPADGIPNRDRINTIDRAACMAFLAELEQARQRAMASRSNIQWETGEQCKFCPSRVSCPGLAVDEDPFN